MTSTSTRPAPLSFRWLGRDDLCLDRPTVAACGDVVVGRYGGHVAAGAHKNEDGALVWCSEDGWEFALLLDGHNSAQSTALVLNSIAAKETIIARLLAQPPDIAFTSLRRHLLALFQSPSFRSQCRDVQGETACLICARKQQFLWWLCIGDCVVYLFHPELAGLGQFALNKRSFFEWVGQVNAFDLDVPCYASGTRELRMGANVIVMATDGLLECGTRPYEDQRELDRLFATQQPGASADLARRVQTALQRVHQERGGDSATVIAWSYDNGQPATQSS